MSTINDLSVTSSVSPDDKLPIWQNANGVTRGLPVSVLDSRYIQQADISALAISPATEQFISSIVSNPNSLPTFVAGITRALTLANQYLSTSNIEVFFDASFQGPDQYTLVGNSLSFISPIPVGVQMVYVRGGTARLTNGPSDGTVLDSSVASGTRLFRRINDVRSFNDFGAIGDGATDDTAAIAAALAWVQAGTFSVGAPVRAIYQPAGYLFKTSSTLGVSIPCVIRCESHWMYYGTTGSAFVIGLVAPPGGLNRNYDIWFSGFHHAVGNTAAQPTSINDAGANGFEIRNMQFSNVYVGELLGFTRNGFYGNSTNDVYSGQHCQDNNIRLGQVAYNGRGFFANSVSAATGAYQVNHTHIQNAFSNFNNFVCDTGVGAPSANASSSNHFTGTLDAPAVGGINFQFFSQYSTFDFMFIDGAIIFGSTSAYNRFNVANNFSTGASVFDGGTNNWIRTNPPDSSQLPATITVPVAAQQNASGVPLQIGIPVQITPAAGGSTQVIVFIGETSGSMVELTHAQLPAGTGNAVVFPLAFSVGPMKWWFVQASGAGSVAFGNARCVMNG